MESMMRQPELVQPPSVRRPAFPKKLLDESDKFIDPFREASLILPQQALSVSSALLLEVQTAPDFRQQETRKASMVFTLIEQLSAWLSWVKKKFRGSRRQRARLTAKGELALEQLRYLSLLCDATECRTPDEALAAESAFGEAYFEIKSLSSNLVRMSQKEEENHFRHYSRHMSSILRALD
jgi:hypothetical protein